VEVVVWILSYEVLVAGGNGSALRQARDKTAPVLRNPIVAKWNLKPSCGTLKQKKTATTPELPNPASLANPPFPSADAPLIITSTTTPRGQLTSNRPTHAQLTRNPPSFRFNSPRQRREVVAKQSSKCLPHPEPT